MSGTTKNKPSAADPYSKLAKDVNASPNLVPIIIGVVVAVVLIAGLVAFLSSRSSSDSTVNAESGAAAATNAKQETASVTVTGEDLPPYPTNPSGFLTDPATDPATGRTIPTLNGQTFDGTPITIGPASGKPQVVVFLAHWCPHCQAEVPLIKKWIDEGNLPQGVEISAVSTGVSSQKPNYPPSKWLAREGWQPRVMLDDPSGTAAQAYALPGFPYFVMTDAQGKVLQRGSGEVPIEQFAAAVNNIAAGVAPAPPSSAVSAPAAGG